MLSSGLLSVIGSIVDHRVPMPADDIRVLLAGVASALLAARFPAPDTVTAAPDAWRVFVPDAGAYESLLRAALVLFSKWGYSTTSVAQIASAGGIPASGIYRYFSSKYEILSTGLRRAADRVWGYHSAVRTGDSSPHHTLLRLIEAYVTTSFGNPELATIYYTERVNLTRADQEVLREVQRSTIDSWVRLLTTVRPSLTATQARFLVHAAMALVVDIGRLVHYEDSTVPAYPQACVRKLMELTLWSTASS